MFHFACTDEVKVVNKNILNRRYEHFFQQKNETLTHFFNHFNFLVHDMCRLNMHNTRNSLMLKFLDLLNDSWEHNVDVLKNSEKIATMDLAYLFGNLRNHEETKILRKEIMQDTHRDKYVGLYSNKSQESDSDFSDESDGEALIIKRYISTNDHKPSGFRRFQSNTGSSSSKYFDA